AWGFGARAGMPEKGPPDRAEAPGADDHELLGSFDGYALDRVGYRTVVAERPRRNAARREERGGGRRDDPGGMSQVRVRWKCLRGITIRSGYEGVAGDAENGDVVGDRKREG